MKSGCIERPVELRIGMTAGCREGSCCIETLNQLWLCSPDCVCAFAGVFWRDLGAGIPVVGSADLLPPCRPAENMLTFMTRLTATAVSS